MRKIYILVGTRPNFIKITRFKEIGIQKNIEVKVIHTGQHFDNDMANVFFDQFDLRPDYFLNVGGLSQSSQIANIIIKLEKLMNEIGNPDLFIVPGDVNSTLAGAVVVNKLGIKLAHLESGLRSFDRSMPEEHNRVVTDNLADICFVTEPSGIENLKSERIKAKIFNVGNTMIDTIVFFESQINSSNIINDLALNEKDFFLCTFHRPSNVDNRDCLLKLIELIKNISKKGKVVFPLHPRTKNNLMNFNLFKKIDSVSNLALISPLGYFDFQKLIKNAKLVITDSGGIQEETTFRKVPCLTIRNNTERPITIEQGTNTLLPFDLNAIQICIEEVLQGEYKKGVIPKYWDGKSTKRIFTFPL